MRKPKRSRTDAVAAHKANADHVERNVRIRKSLIQSGGGGAFTQVPICRNTCIGFYEGARSSVKEQQTPGFDDHYLFDGEAGGRNAHDPEGRLRLVDGTIVDVHGWGNDEWSKMKTDGVAWVGKDANWTRFINHASSAYQNLSVCTTSSRFGRSHAMYAKRDISAGEELFYS